MKYFYTLFLIISCLINLSAQEKKVVINDTLTVTASLLFSDDFSGDLSKWIPQFEKIDNPTQIKNVMMDVDSKRGCTVWFYKKLKTTFSGWFFYV